MALKDRGAVFTMVVAAWTLAASAAAQSVAVPTPTETCFVADQHPQIALSVTPADAVKVARIYFHSALGTAFYYVEMQRQGGYFVGVLPKPKLEAGPVTYYAEALDNSFAQFPTPEIQAKVVQRSEECDPKALAATTTPPGALVVLGGAGVPPGFTGVAGMGVAAAAGGGGLGAFLTSTTGIIVSSAVVLGGATAVILVTRDEDEEPASGSR